MSREAFHKLLKKYLEGTGTEEERKIVEQWYELLDDDELPVLKDAELAEIDEQVWGEINEKIGVTKQALAHNPAASAKPAARVRSLGSILAIAASFVGLLLLAGYLLMPQPMQAEFMTTAQLDVLKVVNTTTGPMQIQLNDGSTVLLQPRAELKYPRDFTAAKREVKLQGEAFFDISKDPSRPFYVYSNRLVTQVVGTSFNVKTSDGEHQDEVAVLTGKVIVLKNDPDESLYQKVLPNKAKKVVLTPNQRAIYQQETNELVATLVKEPVPLEAEKLASSSEAFLFEEEGLGAVLRVLEKTYGVDIKTTEPTLLNCSFTGDLANQDLYNQLELICQSIGASYSIRETTILLEGTGCQSK
ncbi:FecR family protein [Cesiribacter sp. SM1]|uniref:FecR family protein n=1 Tax=Cesiribacter sp. SM1 TaxID=2861196 RepID=UPI001CD373AD|nr:FecR family protein [Cesiribacter sp. SM1]